MYKDHLNHPDFDETVQADLLVVGGGVAGTVAALAAAREGLKTVLIQNRPVLGGVSSIEYGEGNGACVNSPWEHYKFLNEIASNGFMVIATGYIPMEDKPFRGPMSTSAQQIESIDWAIAQNADKESPYYGRLDVKHIAAAGMSCGGLQTLENSADERLTTIMICNSGLFLNPGTAVPGMPMPVKEKLQEIKVPVIYILGGPEDIAYENGMDDFHRLVNVPAFAANYPVGHGGTYSKPYGGEFAIPAVAWLKWQLKGDAEAAALFQGDVCGLSQREGWTVEKNQLID